MNTIEELRKALIDSEYVDIANIQDSHNLLEEVGYDKILEMLDSTIPSGSEATKRSLNRRNVRYNKYVIFMMSAWYLTDEQLGNLFIYIIESLQPFEIECNRLRYISMRKEISEERLTLISIRSSITNFSSALYQAPNLCRTARYEYNGTYAWERITSTPKEHFDVYERIEYLINIKDTIVKAYYNKAKENYNMCEMLYDSNEVKEVLEYAIENQLALEKAEEAKEYSHSHNYLMKIAHELYPDLMEQIHENNKKKFVKLIHTIKNDYELILESIDKKEPILDILENHKFLLKDGKLDLNVQTVYHNPTAEEMKKIRILKKWEESTKSKLIPTSPKTFIDSTWICGSGEVSKETKEKAVDYLKERGLPYSNYLMKEAARKIMKEGE